MQFLFLVGLAIVLCLLVGFGYKIFGKDALYVVAFGCAIGSNVYNVGSYGFELGKMIFGVDSVTYTVFVFCAILTYIKFGRKDTVTLTLSVIASIALSALLQFCASWAKYGIDSSVVWGFNSFILSAIATGVGLFAVIYLFDFFDKKSVNVYVSLIIGIFVASIINSSIYFGGVAICGQISDNFLGILAGSYLGKFMTLILCIPTFPLCKNKKEKIELDF